MLATVFYDVKLYGRVARRGVNVRRMRAKQAGVSAVVLASVVLSSLAVACHASSEGTSAPSTIDVAGGVDPENAGPLAPWLSDARVVVAGPDDTSLDCRTAICRHNENTDLTTWNGALWFVHRTSNSQVLGPNSALHVYKSTDDGATFTRTARIPAPPDRDVRDPHFYVVGNRLFVKALTRLPVLSARDSNVDTVTVEMHSDDGVAWSSFAPIAASKQSFWRIKEHAGTYFSASYADGDASVTLFTSADGASWTKGASIFDVAKDGPLETELTFMPSGKLLALVRVDGTDAEMMGDEGRLRTIACWADPPTYSKFTCPQEILGERFDGPVSFFVGSRVFVIARKHLQGTGRKRMSLFELGGNLEGGPLTVKDWGNFPSAGDTSYAGVVMKADGRALVSWYSGQLAKDEPWILGMIDPTNIWQGEIDFSKLQ